MHVTLGQRLAEGAPAPAAQADWKIVERGWAAHVLGEAPHSFPSALEAVKKLRVRAGCSAFVPRHEMGMRSLPLHVQKCNSASLTVFCFHDVCLFGGRPAHRKGMASQ